MVIQCQKCGKEREADLSKVNLETYRKQYPFCRSCGFNRLSSKGWFKKGFKPWNKNKIGVMPPVWNKGTKGLVKPNSGSFNSEMVGEKNRRWKGEKVGYGALHTWLYRQLGKAKKCERCGSKKQVQWANKSWEYKRDTKDWLELCFKCHRKYDKQNWGIASKKFNL